LSEICGAFSAALAVDWEIPSASAAFYIVPSDATASNTRICLIVIRLAFCETIMPEKFESPMH
jgi:hypothetical protein